MQYGQKYSLNSEWKMLFWLYVAVLCYENTSNIGDIVLAKYSSDKPLQIFERYGKLIWNKYDTCNITIDSDLSGPMQYSQCFDLPQISDLTLSLLASDITYWIGILSSNKLEDAFLATIVLQHNHLIWHACCHPCLYEWAITPVNC